MKRAIVVLILLLCAGVGRAATVEPTMYEAPTRLETISALAPVGSHTASLTWVLSVDDDAGTTTPVNCVATANCTQNVYRAVGACSPTSTFSLLTTNPPSATSTTFSDATIHPGQWCYGVTFEMNGLESAKDTVTVSLQPAPVTGATGSAQ